MDGMLKTAEWKKDKLRAGAGLGFTNATDAADYFVKNGMAFRDAHAVVGRLVLYCEQQGKALDELTLEEVRQFAPEAEKDILTRSALKLVYIHGTCPAARRPKWCGSISGRPKGCFGEL